MVSGIVLSSTMFLSIKREDLILILLTQLTYLVIMGFTQQILKSMISIAKIREDVDNITIIKYFSLIFCKIPFIPAWKATEY
jgi:hypothetical protein